MLAATLDAGQYGTIAAFLALIGIVYQETSKSIRSRRANLAKRKPEGEPDLAMDRLLRFIDEIQDQADRDRALVKDLQEQLTEQREETRHVLDRNAQLEAELRTMRRKLEELDMGKQS